MAATNTSSLAAVLDGVPVDQVFTLGCMIASLPLAVSFYHHLHVKSTSTTVRHAFGATIGIAMVYICYGWQFLHLVNMCVISFMCTKYLSPAHKGWVVCALAVGNVLTIHMYNYIYHYMDSMVDVSNSAMVLAMKVSCTAFSVGDTSRPTQDLTPAQQRHKLKQVPSFFEYWCYCFCFLGVLLGPFYHCDDYLDFINGIQYKTTWPMRQALKMVLLSLIFLGLHFTLADTYGSLFNLEPVVLNSGFLFRHFVLWISMFVCRFKYYFGWLFSEAVCYLGGLGYDPRESGDAEWGATIPTVRVLNIELATNLKMFADNWNVFTARFLQFCVYERVAYNKVQWTFMLSATWHGFYPGYYGMFFPLAFGILASRKLRRKLRPAFQDADWSRRLYDVITCLATATLIAFNSSSFELKSWERMWTLQKSFYFWPHIVTIAVFLLTPGGGKEKPKITISRANSAQA